MCSPGNTKPRHRFRRRLPSSTDIWKAGWGLGKKTCPPPWRFDMTITVQIPTALRRHTSGVERITCAAANLGELFSALDRQFPELKPHLRDDAGQIRRFLNIYVNEEDIRFLGGNTYAFQDGDEVLLVPSIAGGLAQSWKAKNPVLTHSRHNPFFRYWIHDPFYP